MSISTLSISAYLQSESLNLNCYLRVLSAGSIAVVTRESLIRTSVKARGASMTPRFLLNQKAETPGGRP
jgi:hypothetical protein